MRGLTKSDSRVCAQEGRREKCPARGYPYGQTFRQNLKLFQDAKRAVSEEKGLEAECFIFGVGVVISNIRKIANAEDASQYPGVTTFDIVLYDRRGR